MHQDSSYITTMVALYPSIPHEDEVETLRERLAKSENFKLPVNDTVKIAEFVPKHNTFEIHGKIKQQVTGKEIGTKFASIMFAFTLMRQIQNF